MQWSQSLSPDPRTLGSRPTIVDTCTKSVLKWFKRTYIISRRSWLAGKNTFRHVTIDIIAPTLTSVSATSSHLAPGVNDRTRGSTFDSRPRLFAIYRGINLCLTWITTHDCGWQPGQLTCGPSLWFSVGDNERCTELSVRYFCTHVQKQFV